MRDLTLSVAGIGEVSVPVGTMVADLLHRLGFSECGRPCTEDVLAIKVNDHLIDTHSELLEGGTAELVHCGSQEALEVIRHSAAHIMAQAVTELFPGTKLGVGPAIRDGFYYDFDTARTITEEEFARIDERM